MVGLAATGTLSYGEFTFDGASTITVQNSFVRDEAKRTVIYHEIVINVTAVVANDDGLDSDLETLRQQLSVDGETLTFINKGFGDDIIVNKGKVRDVAWGPSPKVISWAPIGDDKAAEIEWSVTVRIPVCDSTTRYKGVMAINYDMGFSVDNAGDTTRAISGHILIANTRKGRAVPDIADRYREKFNATTLDGFKREQSWNTTPDKSRVNFTITDTQIPSNNPYPKFVTDIDGDHEVSWSRGQAAQLRNTISVDMSLVAGINGSVAWMIFLEIVKKRLGIALQGSSTQSLSENKKKQGVFLDSLRVKENLFGRDSSFQVGYRVLSDLSDFVNRTGLWVPLGGKWGEWRASMAEVYGDDLPEM